jgi:hypothetical protein
MWRKISHDDPNSWLSEKAAKLNAMKQKVSKVYRGGGFAVLLSICRFMRLYRDSVARGGVGGGMNELTGCGEAAAPF